MVFKFAAKGDSLGVLAFNTQGELAFSILAMKISVRESNGHLCSHALEN